MIPGGLIVLPDGWIVMPGGLIVMPDGWILWMPESLLPNS